MKRRRFMGQATNRASVELGIQVARRRKTRVYLTMKVAVHMFLALLVLCACLARSIAQEKPIADAPQTISAEKRALIAELLEVVEIKKNATAVLNAIVDQEEKQIPELVWQDIANTTEVQQLSAQQQAELRKKLIEDSARESKKIRELFIDKIDFQQLVEDISYKLYDKYFTEAEIKDLISFYRSPTGKKTIAVMP